MDTTQTSKNAEAPVAEEADRYKGLGGWLILVGFGVVVSPIRMLAVGIPIYREIFENGTWSVLTSPGSEYYDPLLASFIGFEIVCDLILVAVSIFMIYLFFSKHYWFPKFYIGFVAANFAYIILDAWIGTLFWPEDPMFDPETKRELTRYLISSAIWVPYMLSSRRVRATFVEKRPAVDGAAKEIFE